MSVRREVEVEAPPEDVWDALASEESTKAGLFPNVAVAPEGRPVKASETLSEKPPVAWRLIP